LLIHYSFKYLFISFILSPIIFFLTNERRKTKTSFFYKKHLWLLINDKTCHFLISNQNEFPDAEKRLIKSKVGDWLSIDHKNVVHSDLKIIAAYIRTNIITHMLFFLTIPSILIFVFASLFYLNTTWILSKLQGGPKVTGQICFFRFLPYVWLVRSHIHITYAVWYKSKMQYTNNI
jgi:hypothetical protein